MNVGVEGMSMMVRKALIGQSYPCSLAQFSRAVRTQPELFIPSVVRADPRVSLPNDVGIKSKGQAPCASLPLGSV
jgi:hypothetical protein